MFAPITAGAVTVEAGTWVEAAKSDKTLVITSPPKQGSARVATCTQDVRQCIIYLAAKPGGYTDTLAYTDGGLAKTTSLTVDAAADSADPAKSASALPLSSAKALVELFVLAAILESGLAVIFNWRPFVIYFDGRGVKAVVSVTAAYVLMRAFDIDIIAQIARDYSSTAPSEQEFSQFVTALVVAGGSGGVNTLLTKLGMRDPARAQDVIPRPGPTEAWISVRLTRDQAVGPVFVALKRDAGAFEYAGTINGSTHPRGVLSWFIRDFGRFPNSGGHTVTPTIPYSIQLEGVDRNGNRLVSATPWGPHALTPGAFIDVALRL